MVYLNTFSLSCTYCTAAQRGDEKDCITMVTAHHTIKISQSNYRQKKRWSRETQDDSLMTAVCNMEKLNYYRNIQSKKLRKSGRSPDNNKVNVCLPFCLPGDLNDLDVVQTHTQRPTV